MKTIDYNLLTKAENKNNGKNKAVESHRLYSVYRFGIVRLHHNTKARIYNNIRLNGLRFDLFTKDNIKKYCYDKNSLKAFYLACRVYEKRILAS